MVKKSNYHKIDLRRGVDHIGICCVFICHDGKGNVLMHKRSAQCRDERGRWDSGAGSMEHGETFEKAVRREIWEEYRVVLAQLTFCGATNVLRRNGKQHTHWVALVFAAKINPKNVKNGDPKYIDAIDWFRGNKLPKPLHSQFLKHFALVRKAGVKI